MTAQEDRILNVGFCNDCLRSYNTEHGCTCWMQRFSGMSNLHGYVTRPPVTDCLCLSWQRDKWVDSRCGECGSVRQ